MSARYCGRQFSADELACITELIAQDPRRSRAQLSRLTCQALHWYKPDGALKDMSARVAMLRMHNDGLITLPAPRCKRPDPSVHLSARTHPGTPITQPAGTLKPLRLQRVGDKSHSRLWQ